MKVYEITAKNRSTGKKVHLGKTIARTSASARNKITGKEKKTYKNIKIKHIKNL